MVDKAITDRLVRYYCNALALVAKAVRTMRLPQIADAVEEVVVMIKNPSEEDLLQYDSLYLPDHFIEDIMTTALEGGIGYWCNAVKVKDKTSSYMCFEVTERYDNSLDEAFLGVLNSLTIRRGIRLVLDGMVEVSPATLSALRRAVKENYAGYLDSEAADCIVQAGLFDKLVYG